MVFSSGHRRVDVFYFLLFLVLSLTLANISLTLQLNRYRELAYQQSKQLTRSTKIINRFRKINLELSEEFTSYVIQAASHDHVFHYDPSQTPSGIQN